MNDTIYKVGKHQEDLTRVQVFMENTDVKTQYSTSRLDGLEDKMNQGMQYLTDRLCQVQQEMGAKFESEQLHLDAVDQELSDKISDLEVVDK